jgi:hypothetical protein
MEQSKAYLVRVTKPTDHLIQELMEPFFAGFAPLRLLLITWMVVRPRQLMADVIPVVILPLDPAPQCDPVYGPPPFEEHPDP